MNKKLISISIIFIASAFLFGCNNLGTTTITTASTTTSATTMDNSNTTTTSEVTNTTQTSTTIMTIPTINTSNIITTLAPGFTSLDDPSPNSAIGPDDSYTVGGETFSTVDTYKTIYNSEPSRYMFNYLKDNQDNNKFFYAQMVEGLVTYNRYGNLVSDMAYGYKVMQNEDGTETWTFELKQGVPWVINSSGYEYAEMTSDDFVSSMKYILDPTNGSDNASLVKSLISGASEYYDSLNTDTPLSFDTVGVKAISKYEVAYTLIQPTPYFLTYLTESAFLPVSQQYLDLQGSGFGTTENNILVNGPYRMTSHETNQMIEFTANETYWWDLIHVYAKTVECYYVPDSADATVLRTMYESGQLDSFVVNRDDTVGYQNYVTGPNDTGTIDNPYNQDTNTIKQSAEATYFGFFQFARTSFYLSDKTEAEKNATELALENKNFRLGFLYGLDVMQLLTYYNPQNPASLLTRSLTIPGLAQFNGKDYTDYVNDTFNMYQGKTGVDISQISNGSDPIYNVSTATTYFQNAKTELLAGGLTESDFPIHIEVLVSSTSPSYSVDQSMYNGLANTSNGILTIDFIDLSTVNQTFEWPNMNFDFSLGGVWAPEYGDPTTFLGAMAVGGEFTSMMGLGDLNDTDNQMLAEQILGGYTSKYETGVSLTNPTQANNRYSALAQAEYSLIYQYALIIPYTNMNESQPTVSNLIPFTRAESLLGLSRYEFKNIIVTDSAITQSEYSALKTDYDMNK